MFSATKSQDHYIMFHIVKDGCYWLFPLKPADRTYFLFQFYLRTRNHVSRDTLTLLSSLSLCNTKPLFPMANASLLNQSRQ